MHSLFPCISFSLESLPKNAFRESWRVAQWLKMTKGKAMQSLNGKVTGSQILPITGAALSWTILTILGIIDAITDFVHNLKSVGRGAFGWAKARKLHISEESEGDPYNTVLNAAALARDIWTWRNVHFSCLVLQIRPNARQILTQNGSALTRFGPRKFLLRVSLSQNLVYGIKNFRKPPIFGLNALFLTKSLPPNNVSTVGRRQEFSTNQQTKSGSKNQLVTSFSVCDAPDGRVEKATIIADWKTVYNVVTVHNSWKVYIVHT